MKPVFAFFVPSFLALSFCGCASPMPAAPPGVRVTQLEPTLITAQAVKFQAKLVIDNRVGADLNIEKIAYGLDLREKPVFTDSLKQLQPMRSYGQRAVTIPFEVPTKDLTIPDAASNDEYRVTFRGEVCPVGAGPSAFKVMKSIRLPKVPTLSFEGTDGWGFDESFRVHLRIKNPNAFPLSVKSPDAYAEIVGKRHKLQAPSQTEVRPGAMDRIVLRLEQPIGRVSGSSKGKPPRFLIGGSLSFQTPYGLIYIPLRYLWEPK